MIKILLKLCLIATISSGLTGDQKPDHNYPTPISSYRYLSSGNNVIDNLVIDIIQIKIQQLREIKLLAQIYAQEIAYSQQRVGRIFNNPEKPG